MSNLKIPKFYFSLFLACIAGRSYRSDEIIPLVNTTMRLT